MRITAPKMDAVHVAVGVIKNSEGKILIAKRPTKSHQGGLWEFPGGKVEKGETLFQALKRELLEELGLSIFSSSPLIKIAHDYGDKKVLLDVHWVSEFDLSTLSDFTKVGKEGQPIEWVDVANLHRFQFPAANIPILNAIQLPSRYAITGEYISRKDFIEKLENIFQQDIKLIQLRAKHLDLSDYKNLAQAAIELCKSFNVQLQLNLTPAEFQLLNIVDENVGLHLRSSDLFQLQERPIDNHFWLSASCHSAQEIEQAKKIGVDFICLSPIQKTNTHPESEILGWKNFSDLAMSAACPVYALGGVTEQNLEQAIEFGAQGIAAISAWWKS